jgi:CheY-like chemotaxis protein
MTGHEIRTPLNAIIGLADAVVEKTADPEAAERLRTISRSGARLLGVVNDLLDLSRVEAGRLDLEPAPTELGALCGEVQALFALRARQQGISLSVERQPDVPLWLEIDGPRLQQVLFNLVGNALKFTREGGIRLLVTVTRDGPAAVGLRFSVIDTGPGIPADQQAKLFQPYVQLPGASRSAVPGTGLGLAISRRLVGLFGGTLALRSTVGEGSEFHFSIEARRAAPPEPPPAPAPAPVAAPAGLRVLAADDNIANQEVLRSILEIHCAHVEVVDGGEAAVDALRRERFDAALIDLEMPDMDGYTVVQRVRAGAAGDAARTCRVIAFSAYGREQAWPRCRDAGFDDFVEKPINRKLLLAAIRGEPFSPN